MIEMIILITGASHTGKTALAQKLLEKYKYPYLSIDHLKMGLIRSGNTELTPMSDDKDLTAYLWPIVREMVKTAIENKQNFIIEGCYIPFGWQKDFDSEYLENIQYYCEYGGTARSVAERCKRGFSDEDPQHPEVPGSIRRQFQDGCLQSISRYASAILIQARKTGSDRNGRYPFFIVQFPLGG